MIATRILSIKDKTTYIEARILQRNKDCTVKFGMIKEN
jgi:hypothetical protein